MVHCNNYSMQLVISIIVPLFTAINLFTILSIAKVCNIIRMILSRCVEYSEKWIQGSDHHIGFMDMLSQHRSLWTCFFKLEKPTTTDEVSKLLNEDKCMVIITSSEWGCTHKYLIHRWSVISYKGSFMMKWLARGRGKSWCLERRFSTLGSWYAFELSSAD